MFSFTQQAKLTSDKLLGPCLSRRFLCSWLRLEESLLRTLLPTEYSTGLELCDVPILYRSSCKFPVVFDFSKLPLLENTPIQIHITLYISLQFFMYYLYAKLIYPKNNFFVGFDLRLTMLFMHKIS